MKNYFTLAAILFALLLSLLQQPLLGQSKINLDVEAPNLAQDTLARFRVANTNQGDALLILNGTGQANRFLPTIIGRNQSGTIPLLIIGSSDNDQNGDAAGLIFDARKSDGPFENRRLFQWRSWTSPKMTMLASGNLGIGTISPVDKLQVNGELAVGGADAYGRINLIGSSNGTIKYGAIRMVDQIGELGGNARDDLLLEASGGVFVNLDENGNGISGDHDFAIFNNGNHLMAVKSNGQVSIGTNTPANGFKLSVDGKIASEEVMVELSGSWPDYVFDSDYLLKSLDEVRQYISANQHLPGVPSASQVETHGLQLGEMQRILIEKVEELTLYILEQDEQLRKQQEQIDFLIKNQAQ